MILHLLLMRKNVNQNIFNDRKNVSATALQMVNGGNISIHNVKPFCHNNKISKILDVITIGSI